MTTFIFLEEGVRVGGNFQGLLKSKKLSKAEILLIESSLNWTIIRLHVQFIYSARKYVLGVKGG